ncbi:MAG: acyl-CoA synthetase [Acidimicrobiales bacterium]|nr:acyl-CoA synthetase [Acidimicrobiales bacterium]
MVAPVTTQLSIPAALEAVAAAVPDRDCFVFRGRRWSWRSFDERTRRFGRHLVDAGLGLRRRPEDCANWESPHDHVALYLHNGNEYVEAMIGSYKARCAPININYRYVAEELRYVLRDAGAAVVVVHSTFTPVLAEVLDDLEPRPAVIQVADDSGLPLLEGAQWYEDVLAASPPELPDELVASWTPDDLYIIYTGGTTGMPKGVLWRQGDFLEAALGVAKPVEELAAAAPRSSLRTLPSAPFMHGAAHWNALSAWLGGGTVIVQDHPSRLDAHDVWSVCERERVTALQIVGDAFARPLLEALDAGHYDLSTLRFLLTGGAVLSPLNKAAFLEKLPGLTVVDVLGSSESGRQAVRNVKSGAQGDAATFQAGPHARVLDDFMEQVLEPGDERSGWLGQAGAVPRGYLGDEAKTARTFPTIDGVRYAVAGDRARLLADGSLELLGRDSVTINSGGEKIFAEEVEQALKTHPGVDDVIVVGRPSERWGNEVVAVVQLRAGASTSDDELIEAAGEHIARYKLPKAILRVEVVKRSPSGKADYRWAKQVATGATP